MKVLTGYQLERLNLIKELLTHASYATGQSKFFYQEEAIKQIFDFTHKHEASITGESCL